MAAAEPSLGGYHGFSLDITVPPGTYPVCATAFFPSGTASALGCRDVFVG